MTLQSILSTTSISSSSLLSITNADRVTVQGRYFVYENDPSRRFLIKGIAFPEPPSDGRFNATGWISILKQIRDSSNDVNTVRLYRLAPVTDVDYTEFFKAAAELGFYIIIPLTSIRGAGVLGREVPAPNCYSPALYQYGTQLIQELRSFPNVLGGVLGNEVMNSVESWTAAPCILAYARDLKLFDPTFTLIYTMQHDGIGAALRPSEAVHLTMKYMTEQENASIDVLGVNIESWCSSTQTFELNPDGSVGTYRDLYDHMYDSNISLFFSEDGCSIQLFNRDNGLLRGARDWKQMHTILGKDMLDRWSGFIAYAYDGPVDFRMTSGGPWDGSHTLTFNQDMVNFLDEMEKLKVDVVNVTEYDADTSRQPPLSLSSLSPLDDNFIPGVTAIDQSLPTDQIFLLCCNLTLLPVHLVPTYFDGRTMTAMVDGDPTLVKIVERNYLLDMIMLISMGTLVVMVWRFVAKRTHNNSRTDLSSKPLTSTGTTTPTKGYSTFESDSK